MDFDGANIQAKHFEFKILQWDIIWWGLLYVETNHHRFSGRTFRSTGTCHLQKRKLFREMGLLLFAPPRDRVRRNAQRQWVGDWERERHQEVRAPAAGPDGGVRGLLLHLAERRGPSLLRPVPQESNRGTSRRMQAVGR